jgi:uncharacterized protein DUF6519
MKGDFSRLTFDPEKHYDSVLAQQGRVTLDADQNEQRAIDDHRLRRTTADVVGPAGGPLIGGGFKITPGGAILKIGAGTYYVDGLRCVNEAEVAHNAQPDLPAGAPIFQAPPAVPTAAPPAGRYLAYLDVWRRHLTALEDPAIRETALTADTATRLKTVWQMRCLRLGNVGASGITCDADLAPWQAFTAPPLGTLAARAKAATPATNPCMMPESAGYRRLENHLYRVEVHKTGQVGGGATFKWARDNGTLVVRWLESNGKNLTVSSVGHDRYSGFQNGQWIELTDDDRERRGEPGVMVRIETVRGNVIAVDMATADGPVAIAGFPTNPKIRGWDGAGAAPITVPGTNQGYLPIESGLEIRFAAGVAYRSGDYWLVPARSGVGIEWPQAAAAPKPMPPHGVAHAYAKLAILDFDGTNWTLVGDCRKLFAPLSDMTSFLYLGGDGQEAMPDSASPGTLIPLAETLRTGVTIGETPVAGARVRFKVTLGAGRLTGGVAQLMVLTNAEGIAEAGWSLHGGTLHQEVVAELLDSTDDRRGLPIRFAASLSRAAEVSFDPANTPEISGAKTVQAAIEALYKRKAAGCATYVLSPDADWAKVLRELPKGQDAIICFRQGVYNSLTAVRMEGLGHVIIHGGGEATRISVARSESALEFASCASVTVRDLLVEANETGGDWSPVRHLNGTLTMTDCAAVEVSGCTLRSGASVRNERTCLTVRISPSSTAGQTRAPVRSARICDNLFLAGYGQTGLLVTDCLFSLIRDNRFQVQARPAGLTFERLVAEPNRRARLARQVRGKVVAGGQASGGRVVPVGRYRVELSSPVAETEWRALMRTNPPRKADTGSPEAVRAYIARIADAGLKAGTGKAPLNRHTELMRRAMGASTFDGLAAEAKRNLLLGEVTVTDLRDTPGATAVLTVGEVNVAVSSPISQQDWDAMARAAPPATPVADAKAAGRYVRDLSRRVVSDPAFRARFPAVDARFVRAKADNPAFGQQAVVCAGALSREVQVTGNLIQDFYQGVRVAVSDRGETAGKFSSLKSVTVADNSMQLRVPFDYEPGSFGMLIGNADRVRVTGNNLALSDPNALDQTYVEGIRVWGHLGPLMILRENHVSVGRIGLRVEHVGPLKKLGAQQWLAADNMVDAGGAVIVAPTQVQRRNNAVF